MLVHTSRLFERFHKQVNGLFKLPRIFTMPVISRAKASSDWHVFQGVVGTLMDLNPVEQIGPRVSDKDAPVARWVCRDAWHAGRRT
jgi:hypothetical protein